MSLAYFPPTSDADTVWAMLAQILQKIGYAESLPLTESILQYVADAFEGRDPNYLPIDTDYHDFAHTLQATTCAARIMEGANTAGSEPLLSRRECEILLAATLLHDTGFLKTRNDLEGTGAKYTLVHEGRSAEFAAEYLPRVGFSYPEVLDVTTAIRCTGPGYRIRRISFHRPPARTVAAILVTADYLGQMASSDYVYKLPILYQEFEEAYDFANIPLASRAFRSKADLIRKTPDFWTKLVRPMLDADLEGVYRHIPPMRNGANPYLVAVERNIEMVRMLERAPSPSLDSLPVSPGGMVFH